MRMVTVIYSPKRLCMFIEGHAGADKKGRDIVCAAISALEFTLMESLFSLEREGLCTVSAKLTDKGDTIKAQADEDSARVRDTFDTLACGFSLMAEKLPRYVCFLRGE